MIEGPNTHDQIALYVFHSSLIEVQTNAAIATWPHLFKRWIVLSTGFVQLMVSNQFS